MPYSDPANKEWTKRQVLRLQPKTILDVGPGSGVYGEIMQQIFPEARCDAVEIWAPYIEDFQLRDKYNNVYISDACLFSDYAYDLVILGDVIEHMKPVDAITLWTRISKSARAAILSIPIVHYPQGPHAGNPYETHLEEDWDTSSVLEKFSGITQYQEFPITGVFVAQFWQP